MIIKVMDCALEYAPENVRKVRLYGVAYEKLMNEGNYELFKEIDDYYLTYDGMVDSVRDPSHRYHKLNVLHAPRGTQKWRIDDKPVVKKQQRKQLYK